MNSGSIRLYSYWRSSAAYRVRIALNLKGLPYETVPVHLARDGGEQHKPPFSDLNPQELVPVLLHGNRILRQSMAIMEYLDETWPNAPLMPATARDRQRVRALAQVIACDIHPLNNLRVLQFFEHTWNVPQAEREAWVRHWIQAGFEALETTLCDNPSTGTYCDGEVPTMADCCLVPQVYNASRFGVDMAPYRTLRRINEACLALEAFDAARPENQPDAPAAC
ncbi:MULTISPECIES: maleylacetoacetate isomerase [unclassified Arenimonas]|uniref:maleylacetoacetate isomerase n=1 Tax=unclassified Arenimonas TaxID=2641713 RepID=UPI00086B8716|nr:MULTISPECIES: maleylacetoacetate isomerase [unclassified Arenimonas]ODS64128.1 MAG: maleylacetoacetate isomerase [Arenimonas sp. SCN 70-307]